MMIFLAKFAQLRCGLHTCTLLAVFPLAFWPLISLLRLPGCGHTFCEGCLKDWFSTILMKHMNAHPQYNPNTPPQVPYFLVNILQQATMSKEQIRALAALLPQPIPQPSYNCPSCRAEVKTPPIECFTLKSLVRTVATVQGETNPRKTKGTRNYKTKARQQGPWDGFFPR